MLIYVTLRLAVLSAVRKSGSVDKLIVTISGGTGGGGNTWFDLEVAVEFARWLKPEFI